MATRQILRLGWLVVFVTVTACKNSNLPRIPVRGNVTCDGTPVKHGMITFRPASGVKGPSTGTAIVDGEFSIGAEKGPTAGLHNVEVKIATIAKDAPHPDQPAVAMRENLQFKTFSEHVDISREKSEFHFSFTTDVPPARH